MTQENKTNIRAALSKATGGDIGEVYPEFFLSASAGNVEAKRFECKAHKIVHLQIALVGGKLEHYLALAFLN